MKRIKLLKSSLLMLLSSTIIVISGCNGGGVAVNYAPVSTCNSIDFSVECNR
jgi:hypothetical protein